MILDRLGAAGQIRDLDKLDADARMARLSRGGESRDEAIGCAAGRPDGHAQIRVRRPAVFWLKISLTAKFPMMTKIA